MGERTLQLLKDGEVVDEYEVPEHGYYRVESPDGALIAELDEHGEGP